MGLDTELSSWETCGGRAAGTARGRSCKAAGICAQQVKAGCLWKGAARCGCGREGEPVTCASCQALFEGNSAKLGGMGEGFFVQAEVSLSLQAASNKQKTEEQAEEPEVEVLGGVFAKPAAAAPKLGASKSGLVFAPKLAQVAAQLESRAAGARHVRARCPRSGRLAEPRVGALQASQQRQERRSCFGVLTQQGLPAPEQLREGLRYPPAARPALAAAADTSTYKSPLLNFKSYRCAAFRA